MQPNVTFNTPLLFDIEETYEFTVAIEANNKLDTIVKTVGGFSNTEAMEILEYYNINEKSWVQCCDGFDIMPAEGIPLHDMILKFRASFIESGSQDIVFKIVDIVTEEILGEGFTAVEVVEPSGTSYLEVYEAFLAMVTDERLARLTIEELCEDLLPLLKNAIYYLCRLAKVPGYSLHNRDDENYHFIEKLTEHETEALAFAMVVCWTEQQLNSTRLIEQQYYDAGIKTYSPNETMRNLLTLHDSYYKKLKNKLTEYTYKTVDIKQFGGK